MWIAISTYRADGTIAVVRGPFASEDEARDYARAQDYFKSPVVWTYEEVEPV